ncbi:MAG: PASTA domain-containing protein, partial [Candidatus Hydrogenedentes bacterium]|nr:PASTA domain-containing protein [Candidatus Hydrogenedentota bacterium]
MKRMSRIALATSLVSLCLFMVGCPPPASVDVPNVVGLMRSAAITAITGAGLAVGTVTEVFNDTIPAGRVTSQTPLGGTSVSPASTVDLVISKGPFVVPNVVGLVQGNAEKAIIGAGLEVGTITEEYRSAVPIGQVIL